MFSNVLERWDIPCGRARAGRWTQAHESRKQAWRLIQRPRPVACTLTRPGHTGQRYVDHNGQICAGRRGRDPCARRVAGMLPLWGLGCPGPTGGARPLGLSGYVPDWSLPMAHVSLRERAVPSSPSQPVRVSLSESVCPSQPVRVGQSESACPSRSRTGTPEHARRLRNACSCCSCCSSVCPASTLIEGWLPAPPRAAVSSYLLISNCIPTLLARLQLLLRLQLLQLLQLLQRLHPPAPPLPHPHRDHRDPEASCHDSRVLPRSV
jgi:hypothetical protein